MRASKLLPILALTASALLSVWLAKGLDGTATDREPRDGLSFEPAVIDLGRVPQKLTTDAVFTLTNLSAKVIEIEQIYTSCSCTLTRSYERRVDPGRSIRLAVSFKADAPAGPKANFITVNYRERGDVMYKSKYAKLIANIVAKS